IQHVDHRVDGDLKGGEVIGQRQSIPFGGGTGGLLVFVIDGRDGRGYLLANDDDGIVKLAPRFRQRGLSCANCSLGHWSPPLPIPRLIRSALMEASATTVRLSACLPAKTSSLRS